MKILFIGDSHLKITNFQQTQDFLTWLTTTILASDIDMVVNLGDIFHTHGVLRSEILKVYKDHVEAVSKKYTYYHILGNHEFYKPTDSKYHALQSFDIPNFVVIDKVVHDTKLGISFVPYIPVLAEFPTKTCQILIAHQTFIGADYGFMQTGTGIDAATVGADIIISGHVHKRQSFGKVIYPGSSFAQSANDIDQSKGIMIFDTKTYEYSFIDCALPMWKSCTFEISAEYSIDAMHREMEYKINDKDNWIVYMNGPKAEIVSYLSSDRFINFKQGKQISTRVEYNDTKKSRVSIKAEALDDIVTSYVNKVYTGTIDKQVIIKKALEISKKVI